MHLPTVGSTNAAAFEHHQSGASAPFWITADQQTAGKGRHGRLWQSPPGTLSVSLLLGDPAPLAQLPQLAYVTALAMADAVEDVTVSGLVQLKWPNDLLIDGAKLCGILMEARGAAQGQLVVIGAGVNCLTGPKDLPYRSTSLLEQGFRVEPAILFAAFRQAMAQRLDDWGRGENFAAIKTAWQQRAIGIGANVTIELPLGRSISGTQLGLAPDGRLRVRGSGDTEQLVSAGDLFFPQTENE